MSTIMRFDREKDEHGEFVKVSTKTDRKGITFRITSENRVAMDNLFGKRILIFVYATNEDGRINVIGEASFQSWPTKKNTSIGATK